MFGFSEFSHHSSLEGINSCYRNLERTAHDFEIERLSRATGFSERILDSSYPGLLARTLEAIEKGNEPIKIGNILFETSELSKQESKELYKLVSDMGQLQSEIESLERQSTALRENMMRNRIQIPKTNIEALDFKHIEAGPGGLEGAKEYMRTLTVRRNNLQANVSQYNQALASHQIVMNEIAQRLAAEDSIAQACKQNDKAIEQQLNPSGKSAQESAEVFIEQFKQEAKEEAKQRLAAEDSIAQACKQNDKAIEQQLNPSGKSAQESAEVFIEQFKQEAKEEAKQRLAAEDSIAQACKQNDKAIEQQLNPSGKSAQESAEVFIEQFKQEVKEETKKQGLKATLKGMGAEFINTIKSHKKAAIIVSSLTAILTGTAIYLKIKSKNNNTENQNVKVLQSPSFDKFAKKLKK